MFDKSISNVLKFYEFSRISTKNLNTLLSLKKCIFQKNMVVKKYIFYLFCETPSTKDLTECAMLLPKNIDFARYIGKTVN